MRLSCFRFAQSANADDDGLDESQALAGWDDSSDDGDSETEEWVEIDLPVLVEGSAAAVAQARAAKVLHKVRSCSPFLPLANQNL
jgi:hypothetical protein